MKNNQVEHIFIQKVTGKGIQQDMDHVAVEEPLGILLSYSSATGYMQKNISVTMRTPGHDEELAAGFLFTEGILKNDASIKNIHHIASDENRVLVDMHEGFVPVLNKADRNFYSTSGCGICGKASIDVINTLAAFNLEKDSIRINADLLYGLQDILRKQQEIFQNTGGIHACALFDLNAGLIMAREDVGRHNALDKLIGAALLNDALPLNNCILLLSGRASFELLQKSVMAGIKIVAAVGAPSSLAVELAAECGITLIGFLRDHRFNLYSGSHRIVFGN